MVSVNTKQDLSCIFRLNINFPVERKMLEVQLSSRKAFFPIMTRYRTSLGFNEEKGGISSTLLATLHPSQYLKKVTRENTCCTFPGITWKSTFTWIYGMKAVRTFQPLQNSFGSFCRLKNEWPLIVAWNQCELIFITCSNCHFLSSLGNI